MLRALPSEKYLHSHDTCRMGVINQNQINHNTYSQDQKVSDTGISQ